MSKTLNPSKKNPAAKTSRARRTAPSAWKRLRLRWWKKQARGARMERPAADEMSLRAELFGVRQLENYAKILAKSHEVEVVREPEKLLHQLAKSANEIHRCHEIIAESVRKGARIAPAGEWLLDNYHLIQEQIELARTHLPPGYSRELPRLIQGPRKGFPRVYDVVMELVRHSDGQVDPDNLSHFIRAYQTVHPLTLGELWAVPIMLRLSLIENLHLVAQRIAWRRSQRDAALVWAKHFLNVVEKPPAVCHRPGRFRARRPRPDPAVRRGAGGQHRRREPDPRAGAQLDRTGAVRPRPDHRAHPAERKPGPGGQPRHHRQQHHQHARAGGGRLEGIRRGVERHGGHPAARSHRGPSADGFPHAQPLPHPDREVGAHSRKPET
jgi:hypothetical protein